MYQKTHLDYEDYNAHNGEYPRRQFYYRKSAPYDGGDRALIIEIRAEGPVQCKRDLMGNLTIAESDLLSNVLIDQTQIICGVSNNKQNWIEYFENRMLYNGFTSPGSITERRPGGYCCYSPGSGELIINNRTGKVIYSPRQIIAESATGAYKTANFHTDITVKTIGVVQPSIMVQGVACVGVESSMRWKFDAKSDFKNVGVALGFDWTNSISRVDRTMRWQIWRAYRIVQADGTLGPITPVDEAVPQNDPPVEFIHPIQLENPPKE
jgi:hypothetical protein